MGGARSFRFTAAVPGLPAAACAHDGNSIQRNPPRQSLEIVTAGSCGTHTR